LTVLLWRWGQHSLVLWRTYPALLEAAGHQGGRASTAQSARRPRQQPAAGQPPQDQTPQDQTQQDQAPQDPSPQAQPATAANLVAHGPRRRVWIVIRHECRPASFYAGMRMVLFLALELAERGFDVTFLALQPQPLQASDAELLAFVTADLGRRPPGQWSSRRVEDLDPDTLAGPDDLAVATCWESFVVARRIAAPSRAGVPVYLIQDDERIFYPHSSLWLEVLRSYHSPAHRIFSGAVLAEHFRRERLTPERPDLLHVAYTCYVDPLFVAAGQARQARRAEAGGREAAGGAVRGPVRLCLYGRPEVPRNGYETIRDALSRLDPARLARPLEIVALGAPVPLVKLGNGLSLHGLGKLSLAEYAAVLARMDLGLSLMFSPHPSYPPLEMAAAGVRVLTNRWPGKDPSLYSAAIRGVDLIEEDLAAVIHAEVERLAVAGEPPLEPFNAALVTHDRQAVMAEPVERLLALLPAPAGVARP
jgi:hypothetical protein